MAKRGDGYGSEDHLATYRGLQPTVLDNAIRQASGLTGAIEWAYPATRKASEPKGIDFLTGRPDAIAAWKGFWPQTGNQQRWDGIAKCGDEWLLIEAKANHPEFCTPPCGAKADGRKMDPALALANAIEKALEEVKATLGVHRHFTWLSSCYQYANRLAALRFLTHVLNPPIPARLVFVHFIGDRFPEGTPCPQTEAEWHGLIEARRLTLGLPVVHALSQRVHEVFLPAPAVVRV